ncbi:hypothetical protein EHI2019_000514700 [Entamoeba histolytica]
MLKSYMEYFVDSKTNEKRGIYCDEGIEIECCIKWYAKPNNIKYNDVKHKVTQPSIKVFPKKKIMKHPRKPTEIVVYTDSFCYSACSSVTKGLKEWREAILVGFDGDTYGKDEEFEVGLSPTNVIESVSVLSHPWMILY